VLAKLLEGFVGGASAPTPVKLPVGIGGGTTAVDVGAVEGADVEGPLVVWLAAPVCSVLEERAATPF
jgi:hypothetical protein